MIVVFGSVNVDLIARVPRLPSRGATLGRAPEFSMMPGGKGANQALGAARAGARFAGAVREGVAAGSLACLRAGAQDALPTRNAIVRLASTLT